MYPSIMELFYSLELIGLVSCILVNIHHMFNNLSDFYCVFYIASCRFRWNVFTNYTITLTVTTDKTSDECTE